MKPKKPNPCKRANTRKTPKLGKRARELKKTMGNKRAIKAKKPEIGKRAKDFKTPTLGKRASGAKTPVDQKRAVVEKTPRTPKRAIAFKTPRIMKRIFNPSNFMKTESIKVNDIRPLPEIVEIRPLDRATVERYKQAKSQGDRFPPLTIDQDNQLISGYQRLQMYMELFGPEHVLQVERLQFDSLIERIEWSIRENVRHGRPINQQERSRAIAKLVEHGLSEARAAEIFRCSIKSVEQVMGMAVVKRGDRPAAVERKETTPPPPIKVAKPADPESLQALSEKQTEDCSSLALVYELAKRVREGSLRLNHGPTVKALTELSLLIKRALKEKRDKH